MDICVNIVKLTIGGYLFEQPGIIISLTYDVPSESTWEIGNRNRRCWRSYSKKNYPHIIKVTNVKFIPIHTFVPQLFNGITQKEEKFIALTTGKQIQTYIMGLLIQGYKKIN